ncbi:PREDICTED: uncharacterized protein LOC108756352 [Trachymyrmex septentrionalis]|uniref:uncharacterized protein LOC108756352 n=1 Tax=Trachymyrmex septentrionalis TaxID=34720 RepID=UPI00084EE33F|nr:PREDICTED: uncharacterized protein LOC108756352 [Trachymyrmex septentrionalis]
MSMYKSHRGEDCVSWFANELYDLAHCAKTIFDKNETMAEFTSNVKWEKFRDATHCHICERLFEEGDLRVRCHLTGRYRGPSHSCCNLQNQDTLEKLVSYLDKSKLKIIRSEFSNLDAEDFDLLTRKGMFPYEYIDSVDKLNETSWNTHGDYSNLYLKTDVLLLADVFENFRDTCIESYGLDPTTSLDKLASYLDKDKLKIIRSKFPTLSDDEFELLTRKGIFPYDSLTGDTVSESDYAHAANVWQRFSIRTLGEYSDLYLKTDVLLLADIFENFRESCVASYGLDPAHYYTLPGFTWDAMLKHTRVKLELLTDIDMIMFIERGIRGGLSHCSGRYAQANNKYMHSYDSSEQSSYLMYYDVNNLYGWAMCQPLPYAKFQWVKDAANFDASAIALDSPTGYILEVDLEYPQHILVHDRHTDLPFCPTRDKPPGKGEHKLLAILTLYDK